MKQPAHAVSRAFAIAAALTIRSALGADPARVPWTTSRVQGSPEPPAVARLERVRADLSFDNPLDLLHDRATRTWWVAQQGGKVLSFGSDAGKNNVVIDLKEVSRPFSQLYGMVLDPRPEHRIEGVLGRFVYLAYNVEEDKPEGARVSRFRVHGNPPHIDPASEQVLITWPSGGHNGGCLKFGPDGMLYISTGDHASPEPPDPFNTGQSLDDLLSAILRIDVRQSEPGRPYTIPRDNPFVGRPGARPEVWAYGFRNPWRMDFAADGSLWLGDVGWELWETVHRVTAGYNGGWSRMEGAFLVRPDMPATTPVGRPIAAHSHNEAASITGGTFYQGSALAGLRGTYFYGDWETGKVWSLHPSGSNAPVEIADSTTRVVSFATGPDTEMYLIDYQPNGGLYRIAPNVAPKASPFPRSLSQTGVYSDTARRVPASGVLAYEPASPRWHDGALAERVIGIPGSAQAEPASPWKFPAGTVFAKTLSLPSTGAAQPVETQLLHFTGEEWRAYSYRWREDGSDADLVPAEGARHPLPRNAGAGSWTFASRSDCLRCHNMWSGYVLGFNTAQLAHGPKPQLEALIAGGLVVSNAFCKPAFALASPADSSAPVDVRARSWLHANCAPCHRFGAGASVTARFGADEAATALRIVDARPSRGDFGIADARIVAPGQPERSVAWHRINTGGPGHMPPVGSRSPDPVGSRVVADWIRSLGTAGTRPAAGPKEVRSAADALRWLDASLPAPPPEGVVRTALGGTNATVRDLFAAYAPADLRRETLGEGINAARLLTLKGDPKRGAALFSADSGPGCARCHRVGTAEGSATGPNLAGIASRLAPVDLVESLVNPSARIAPEYQWYECETTEGDEVSGFLVRQGSEGVRLRAQDGAETDIAKTRIKSMRPVPASIMPEGLLAGLTEQEAADLLAYLRGLR